MSYDLANFNYRLTTYVLDATSALAHDIEETSSEMVRRVYAELFSPDDVKSLRPPLQSMPDRDVQLLVTAEIHRLMRELEMEHAIASWDERRTDAEVFAFQDALRELLDEHRTSLGLAPMSWAGE